MTPFRTEILENGVELAFFDLSNRYFGDYHRVCIEVHISVGAATGAACPETGHPVPVVQIRHLERMGVAGAELEATRNRMVQEFLQHAGSYLARDDYPVRLAVVQATSRRRQPPVRF